MAKILLVEDQLDLAELVQEWLEKEQHRVEIVGDGITAIENLRVNSYDLMILDLMIPKLSGMEVCRQYRQNMGSMPIIILTAKATVDDKESGFNLGADDYLTKPFALRELAARIRALLRRGTSKTDLFKIGDVIVDVQKYRVTKGGQEVRLLPQEYRLLEFLVRHSEYVYNAEQLLSHVWDSRSTATPDTVRGHILRLRKKLDSPERESVISTVYGLGYKVEAERC